VPILDKDGHEVKIMPEWHKDVQIMALMQWCGHWFEFAGIDPDHDPDVIFFRYKEPTKSTKRRANAARN
jgi:hypothetical protein